MIVMSAKKFRPKKAMLKRIKITGKDKLFHRSTRLNHFNAKDTGKRTQQKRGQFSIAKADQKNVKQLLPI